MVPTVVSHIPNIYVRLLQPSDVKILQKLYFDILPYSIEAKELFEGAIHKDDIVCWVAVDHGKLDEIIGFVIASSGQAKESELKLNLQISDLLEHDSSASSTLFILAVGVLQNYRNLGVATLLIKQAINHAYHTPECRAIYLHVVSDNDPAIGLYKKLEFQLMRTLKDYYLMEGHGRDGHLFVHFVKHLQKL